MNTAHTSHPGRCYELRFQSLFRQGRGWAFPCDAGGHVDMDSLSERARNNYLYARAVIGIEVAHPHVRARTDGMPCSHPRPDYSCAG